VTTPPDEAPVPDEPPVEDDDAQTRQDVLERIDARDFDDNNPWETISTTAESVTVALDARVGCLVRVISWDLDGHFHMTTTWCHGVTLEDLRGARGRGRS
jgi:hypothetical protein